MTVEQLDLLCSVNVALRQLSSPLVTLINADIPPVGKHMLLLSLFPFCSVPTDIIAVFISSCMGNGV